MKTMPWVAAGASLLVLAGCGDARLGSDTQNDPYESTNRSAYASHQVLYRSVVRPVVVFYNDTVPEPARDGIHNFLANIDMPATFGNDLLQGEFTRGGQTLARFVVNTTAGVGGFIDVAQKIGIPEHETGFADTLADYGVGPGPYIYLPIVGPTVPREIAGKLADAAFDPLTYVTYGASMLVSAGRAGVNYADKSARGLATTDEIAATSPDPYATTRLLYEKHLAAEADHTASDSDFDAHPAEVRAAIRATDGNAVTDDNAAMDGNAAADGNLATNGNVVASDSTAPQDTHAYCSSVAQSRAEDAAANGYEPDMQQVVHDGALANCMTVQTAQGSNSGVIALASDVK